MGEIKIFNSTEFGSIRTEMVDGEPWFCLTDLCKSLELTAKIVNQRLADEVVSKYPISDSIGRKQDMLFVNEDGLYDVILESRKENARKFRRWVTSEVLPSIRKNGGYIAGQESMGDDELLAKALLVAQNKIAEREKKITEQQEHIDRMKPKEIFADAVSSSKDSCLIGDLAKIICQNGHKIGQKRLFEWMRTNGYLIKGGSSKNMPTQKAMEMKLFEVKETTITTPDGSTNVKRTTKVTGKGQVYFVNKFAEVEG